MERGRSMKKGINVVLSAILCLGLAACANAAPPEPAPAPPAPEPAPEPAQAPVPAPVSEPQPEASTAPEAPAAPVVYFTKDISAAGLVAVYEKLGVKPEGKVAVKISTGESEKSNHLRPELIKDIVELVDGTIVECNTAYGGSRASAAMHIQLAEDRGYTAIAPFDLLDEDGEISLPVSGGEVLAENFVGSRFADYDYYLVLSHFKGHPMAGYGGAIKNISIGIASASGKSWIHSGGTAKRGFGGRQEDFLKGMAEAGKSVVDSLNGNICYVSVMNRLSVDCDCVANPAEPDMHDIGVLASLDPVALDRACVDLVRSAKDGASLMGRISSREGELTMAHAEKIGLGKLEYRLENID
jgi:uncharacterized Fe-S center protein